jgi:hypothetical protein
MEKLKSDDMFTQIRTAHRMVIAYYKRLYPVLQNTAELLDLEFYYWEPSRFSRPARGTTNILNGNGWEWDLTPGLMTHFLFHNAEDNNKQAQGEWMLNFHVITDTGVLEENMQSNMDSLDLKLTPEQAESILRVNIFVPTRDTSLNWYGGVWGSCEYPDLKSPRSVCLLDEENKTYGAGFEVPLSRLAEENISDWLVDEISTLHKKVLSEIESQNKA